MTTHTYAVLDAGGTVTNVIVVDPTQDGGYPTAGLVDLATLPQVGMGWTRHADGSWTAPPVWEPSP